MRGPYPWISCFPAWFVVLIFNCYVVMTTASFCGEPDPIEGATNNATGSGHYEENTVIRYDCNVGYRISGSIFYTCEDGEWSYGSLTCIRIFCMELEVPEHGQMVGTYTREVGTWVTFECNTGYDQTGYGRLLCRADGEWRPQQPPKCEPKSCGEFGSVENADVRQSTKDGRRNIYGNVIEVTCETGFILIGKARVTCSANGQWDDRPYCQPSSCPEHPGLSSSCISYVDISDSMMTVLCEENSENISVTEVGSSIALCIDDEWDDLNIACYCDCKIDTADGSFTASNLVNGFLKHGHDLQWRCSANSFKSTEETVNCNDGTLSLIPRCKAKVTTNRPHSKYFSTEMDSSTEVQPTSIWTTEKTKESLSTTEPDSTSKAAVSDHESTLESITTHDQYYLFKSTTSVQDFTSKVTVSDRKSTLESATSDDQFSQSNTITGDQNSKSKSTNGNQNFISKTTSDDQEYPPRSTPKSNFQMSNGVSLKTNVILCAPLYVLCIVLLILTLTQLYN